MEVQLTRKKLSKMPSAISDGKKGNAINHEEDYLFNNKWGSIE